MQKRTLMKALLIVVACYGWSASLDAGMATDEEAKDKTKQRAPKVGETAPLFELKMLDRDRSVALRDFKGKRPVVLFFGSYT